MFYKWFFWVFFILLGALISLDPPAAWALIVIFIVCPIGEYFDLMTRCF